MIDDFLKKFKDYDAKFSSYFYKKGKPEWIKIILVWLFVMFLGSFILSAGMDSSTDNIVVNETEDNTSINLNNDTINDTSVNNTSSDTKKINSNNEKSKVSNKPSGDSSSSKSSSSSSSSTKDHSGSTYVGSSKSDKFHNPSCSAAKRIKNSNLVSFSSRENAVNSGYKPCGICHP
jgi:hypothetical protein